MSQRKKSLCRREAKVEANRRRREELRQAREPEELSDADSNVGLGYVVGYTSAGVPSGVTWEELGEASLWSEDDQAPIDERLVES